MWPEIDRVLRVGGTAAFWVCDSSFFKKKTSSFTFFLTLSYLEKGKVLTLFFSSFFHIFPGIFGIPITLVSFVDTYDNGFCSR